MIHPGFTPNEDATEAGRKPIAQAATQEPKKFHRLTEKYRPIKGSVQKPVSVLMSVRHAWDARSRSLQPLAK